MMHFSVTVQRCPCLIPTMIPVDLGAFLSIPRESVPAESGSLLGQKISITYGSSDAWMELGQRKISETGGLLLIQESIPDYILTEYAFGPPSLNAPLPQLFLWLFPECSFEQSLLLPEAFGLFANHTKLLKIAARKAFATENSTPEMRTEKIQVVEKMLRNLRLRHRMVLEEISNRWVKVRNLNQSDINWSSSVAEIMAFNKKHFGRNYSTGEFTDLRKTFTRDHFAVIGI